jgi:hypothetical protein
MPSYLVETFLARSRAGERAAREARARSAAGELTDVRFAGAIHVPDDEICFYVFGAPSSREAELAAQLAGLEPVRVVEAVPSREENRCTSD